jgi:hypothetical protein
MTHPVMKKQMMMARARDTARITDVRVSRSDDGFQPSGSESRISGYRSEVDVGCMSLSETLDVGWQLCGRDFDKLAKNMTDVKLTEQMVDPYKVYPSTLCQR